MATVPDKLSIYQGALAILGQTKLSALTENVARRHHLDEVWDRNFRERVLALEQWDFAKRVSKLSYDATLTPAYGRSRYFERPSDFIRLMALSGSEYFRPPLNGDEYRTEGNYWVCDLDEIYVQYVSDDASSETYWTKISSRSHTQ